MSVGVVILAAGESRRMGEPKLLRPLAGTPILQHTVDLAAVADADELVVVLGHQFRRHRAAVRLPPSGVVVENRDYAAGQAGSLIAGLGALTDSEWAVVLLGDQPEISADALRAVILATRGALGRVVRARYDDGPGHPVALSRSLWPAVGRLRGDEGARELFDAETVTWVELSGDQPPDIDTPDAYRRAIARVDLDR